MSSMGTKTVVGVAIREVYRGVHHGGGNCGASRDKRTVRSSFQPGLNPGVNDGVSRGPRAVSGPILRALGGRDSGDSNNTVDVRT